MTGRSGAGNLSPNHPFQRPLRKSIVAMRGAHGHEGRGVGQRHLVPGLVDGAVHSRHSRADCAPRGGVSSSPGANPLQGVEQPQRHRTLSHWDAVVPRVDHHSFPDAKVRQPAPKAPGDNRRG